MNVKKTKSLKKIVLKITMSMTETAHEELWVVIGRKDVEPLVGAPIWVHEEVRE